METPRKPEQLPAPEKTTFTLEGRDFDFETYNIGVTKDVPNPGMMPTGAWEQVFDVWDETKRPPLISEYFRGYDRVPYTMLLKGKDRAYGVYTDNEGMDEFKDMDMRLVDGAQQQPDWASELWRYARLKNPRVFARDEIQTGIRGLEVRPDGRLRMVLGPALYSNTFFSKGSEGVRTGLTGEELDKIGNSAELNELNEKLVREFGEGKTLREIVAQKAGHLPEFSENVYEQNLGVAGTVLTSDGKFIFVRRGKNVSVNQGINVTASGGVVFNKEKLSQLGIQQHVAGAMADEAHEEIGLKSGQLILGAMQERVRIELGVGDREYDLIPVGFARELPRGGSPEFMFLIRYKGTAKELVRSIMQNDHPDRAEVDELVYAMPAAEVKKLIETKGASSVIQHKAILNLIFAVEFLKNHPWN